MLYLKTLSDIQGIIADLAEATLLWVDTEVADYFTKTPRLSLIQVSAYGNDLTGGRTCIFDVLDQPSLVDEFINTIMVNPDIEKVFHNASYDLRFLGGNLAKNVTCTMVMAKSIPYHILPVQSYSLKSLAQHLTEFKQVSKEEQGGDWGRRPLSESQLRYAAMDTVYLAQVHQKLLHLLAQQPPATADNLVDLEQRYREIEIQWRMLDSEIKDLKERIKEAMKSQGIKETNLFKLSSFVRKTVRLSFADLEELVQRENLTLDLELTLNKENQKALGPWLDQLPVKEELTPTDTLRPKLQNDH